ncbi:ATP synthase [Haematococcus lacustris]|nr:hypothetical protein QJQ45_017454 [Haematococcus lacustris]KAJ9527689.1 hypothetical protein QJQ45_025970 [Haematococcus lacustris]
MMLSASRLLSSGAGCLRSIATSAARLDETAQTAAGVKDFTALWNKKAPSTLSVPEFPSNFLPDDGKPGESKVQGDLFPVNFFTPHSILCQAKQRDTVILPGMEGVFGVKANHVPVISQLKPGIVELHSGADVEKFFISGGWAYVHPNGVTDIQAVEAVTLDQVDAAAVKSALASAMGASAADDYEAAVNRTAVELYSALDSAMDSKA